MRKSMKKLLALLVVVFLTSCSLLTLLSYGQEIPKPGEVIDKSNYKKYAHLFPEHFLQGFENGFDRAWKPFSVKIVETKPAPVPTKFTKLSEKNRGKFAIDQNGFITGGYDFNGLPFPGVTPEDKDFPAKIMWNYAYKYLGDCSDQPNTFYNKRKGEQVSWGRSDSYSISFTGRLYADPKPVYKNPENIYYVYGGIYTVPSSLRNFQFIFYTYLDVTKPDEEYLYLPQMRRVLRGEAGFRSTPLAGTINAWDDFNGGFNGKLQDFTYKFLGEKKVVGNSRNPMCKTFSDKQFAVDGSGLPFASDNWEVRDAYMMEIKSKDPKYPQSKKIIYIDKENLHCIHAIAFDRAGIPWKMFFLNLRPTPLPDGDNLFVLGATSSYDLQFGMGNVVAFDVISKPNQYSLNEAMPSFMINRAR